MRDHWRTGAGVWFLATVAVTGLLAGASVAAASAGATDADTAVTTDPGGTITAERWETVTVTVRATATNVTGYQSALTYDPTVLQVTDVSGTDDFDTPVADVDTGNGSVLFNQIRSGSVANPPLVELSVEVIGTAGQRSDLSFVAGETKFSDPAGNTFEPNSVNGVTIAVQSERSTPNATDASAGSGPGFDGPPVALAVVATVGWIVLRNRRGR